MCFIQKKIFRNPPHCMCKLKFLKNIYAVSICIILKSDTITLMHAIISTVTEGYNHLHVCAGSDMF